MINNCSSWSYTAPWLEFRSPRKVIVWQVPKNLLNSTVSSVKISLVRSERIPTSITLAEFEVFAKVLMKSMSF